MGSAIVAILALMVLVVGGIAALVHMVISEAVDTATLTAEKKDAQQNAAAAQVAAEEMAKPADCDSTARDLRDGVF